MRRWFVVAASFCTVGIPLAAANRDAKTCLLGVSGDGKLGTSGRVDGSCVGHNKADGSFVCSGVDHYVEIMSATGTQDFTVTVSLELETVGETAASVVFFSTAGEENHVGIDSWFTTCTQPGGESPCVAGPHISTQGEKAPALVAGEQVNLTLSRTSNMLSVSINGTHAFATSMIFPVDGFALRPWRSTMHIYRFDVCAERFVPAPPPPPPPPPTVTVFSPGEAGVPVYRIPALCSAGPALVAFIEGRLGGDFSVKKLMTKRSLDGGDTWSEAIVLPNTWEEGWCVGQPTCAYDPERDLLLLQYQNSTAHTEVNGRTFQIVSTDLGVTWHKPTPMDQFLGPYAGVFPGPGNGVVLSNKSKFPGRYVFAAWGVTTLHGHETNYDVVYYSDDGGKTYSTSQTVFPANMTGIFDEPIVAETQNGDVLINMRMGNDAALCGGRHCRFGAVSSDGGASFGPAGPTPLVSPGCQGSVMLHPPSNRVLFSNPHSATSRVNGVLQYSEDNAKTWKTLETIDSGTFAYSCLSLLPARAATVASTEAITNATHVAVLYEGHSGLILLSRPSVIDSGLK